MGLSDFVITKEMEDEEKKIEETSLKEFEAMRRKLEKEEHKKELKEKRYKCLLTILKKSKFYTDFLYKNVLKLNENDGPKNKNCFNADELKAVHSSHEEYQADQSKKNLKTKPAILENKENVETKLTSFGIKVSKNQPDLLDGVCMRDYQLEGLDWLKMQFEGGMNSILADEMGLGKTVQSIALICHLYEQNVSGPHLIIVPLTTLPNWLIEFETFVPQVPVVMLHGNPKERDVIKKTLNTKCRAGWGQMVYPVVITSYSMVNAEKSFLTDIHWKYLIVDEGHILKNYKTQIFRILIGFPTMNRLLLTGTPLQNNMTELWSLLNFLIPEIFNNLNAFETWFQVEEMDKQGSAEKLLKQEKDNHILSLLHEILSPFLLRRIKSDVSLKLPPKKEIVVYCPLTEAQRLLYQSVVDRSIAKRVEKETPLVSFCCTEERTTRAKYKLLMEEENLKKKCKTVNSKSDESVNNSSSSTKENLHNSEFDDNLVEYIIKLGNPCMMLRKVANHLHLVQKNIQYRADLIDERIITSSGKTIILDQLLSRLKARNHKVLIFSPLVQVLNIIEGLMDLRGYKYEMLTGKNLLEERKESIKSFNADPSTFVFLLSTRAGGMGINLTAADTVIIYDSDWNPQADNQAQDRCHRIGQTKPVIVYRLVSTGTYDEKILSISNSKRKLAKMVLKEGKFTHKMSEKTRTLVTLEELKELLESKPHNLEVHSNGSVLSDEEWDKLLDRSDMH